MVLNLWADITTDPALQQAVVDGWDIHVVRDWADLETFARAFSRRAYGRDVDGATARRALDARIALAHRLVRFSDAGDFRRCVETRARDQGLKTLFVLTTRTAHWFRERGFVPSSVERLPSARASLYNYQRNSKIFEKTL